MKIENIERIHHERGSIRSINPNVNQVEIQISYFENDEFFSNPFTITKNASDRVVTYINCINNSCTKEFLDLTCKLEYMLIKGYKNLHEEITCDGFQDEERMRGNGNRCCVHTQLKIKIDYK